MVGSINKKLGAYRSGAQLARYSDAYVCPWKIIYNYNEHQGWKKGLWKGVNTKA